jgi:hypothetical protein
MFYCKPNTIATQFTFCFSKHIKLDDRVVKSCGMTEELLFSLYITLLS